MRVKICGITRLSDAMEAAEAGADALGFIFAPESLRYISPLAAGSIIRNLPPFITPVGVFVNARRSEILEVIKNSGIQCAQLHGEEPPELAGGLPIAAYKAFRVREGFDLTTIGKYASPFFLLDTHAEGSHGGTGKTFDWRIAVEAKRYGRVILGGGITPENVAAAIAAVSPYAIDVNSGVESSPGIKDAAKIRMLFDAIRRTPYIERNT